MRTLRVMTVLALTTLAIEHAQAATNTWNKLVGGNASGSWTNAANPPWSAGALPGATDTADFNTLDITADSTVTLDGDQSINALIFGDTTTSSAANWVLSGGTPSTSALTLGGTASTITVNTLGNGKAATISANLAGTAGMTKAGAGTLTLSGANTYSGGTTLSVGTLNINSTNALGTGIFTIGDRSSSVTINNTSGGPITNANNNPITINTIWRGCTFTGTSDLNFGRGVVTFGDSSVTVSSGTVTFGGAFTNSGMGNLQKYGGGTMTLNGGYTNTSGGYRLIMNAGVVNVNANSYGAQFRVVCNFQDWLIKAT
ncbi:MAG: autotransporter-associated beta strand repeat-containing protein, partial [bacterium]